MILTCLYDSVLVITFLVGIILMMLTRENGILIFYINKQKNYLLPQGPFAVLCIYEEAAGVCFLAAMFPYCGVHVRMAARTGAWAATANGRESCSYDKGRERGHFLSSPVREDQRLWWDIRSTY